MRWIQMTLAAAYALLASSQYLGAAEPCPCEHKAPGHAYASSHKPISEMHAKCLKPVDDYLKWLKEQAAALKEGGMDTFLVETDFTIFSRFDYGVPSRKDSEKMLADRTKEFAAAAAEAGMTSAEADLWKKRTAGHSKGGPVDLYDIESVEKELSRVTSFQQTLNEIILQKSASFIAFFQCAIDNDLPQTANW